MEALGARTAPSAAEPSILHRSRTDEGVRARPAAGSSASAKGFGEVRGAGQLASKVPVDWVQSMRASSTVMGA